MQVRACLDAARGDRLHALYAVAVGLGRIQGEALGLRWEDVTLEADTLRVCHALRRVDGRLRLVQPNSERSRRTFVMPAATVAALRKHRVRQLEDHLLAGSRWREAGFVFTTTVGTPLDGTAVTKRLRGILTSALQNPVASSQPHAAEPHFAEGAEEPDIGGEIGARPQCGGGGWSRGP